MAAVTREEFDSLVNVVGEMRSTFGQNISWAGEVNEKIKALENRLKEAAPERPQHYRTQKDPTPLDFDKKDKKPDAVFTC